MSMESDKMNGLGNESGTTKSENFQVNGDYDGDLWLTCMLCRKEIEIGMDWNGWFYGASLKKINELIKEHECVI